MGRFYRSRICFSSMCGAVLLALFFLGSGCSSDSSSPAPAATPGTPSTPAVTAPTYPPIPLNLLAETRGPGSGTPPLQKDGKLIRLSFLTPAEGRNKLWSIDLTGNPDSLRYLVSDPALDIIEHQWDETGHVIFVADKFITNGKIRGIYTYDSVTGVVKELTEGLTFCPYDQNDIHFSFQIAHGVVIFMATRSKGDAPCDKERNFFVVNTSGQNLREISNGLVELPGATPLSPDGTSIGFMASDGHDNELYVVDIATQVHTQLTKNNFDEIEQPVACSDGRWAFPSFVSSSFEVNVLDPTKSPQVAAVTSGEINFFNLYWNPNCTKLAFQGIEKSTGLSEIYIYSFADSVLTQVTKNGTDEDLLSDPWNPAFDILAFSLPVGELRQLGMTHLDQSPEQWTAHEASFDKAVWAPGGDKILYSTTNAVGNTQIWVRDIQKALHFPLGPARANGIALNFACGDPNFAILRDSDGHDTDIWVVDIASGGRLNVTANAMEDSDPQCGLLPGEPMPQPASTFSQPSSNRSLCSLITCDPGTTCQPATGACVSDSSTVTNCNFPQFICPTDTHCSLATDGATEGTCVPTGYCDADGNSCETGQICNASHVCEGAPPVNRPPTVTTLSVDYRLGTPAGDAPLNLANPRMTLPEGTEITAYFKVQDPDSGDTVTLTGTPSNPGYGAIPECGDQMAGCVSQVPAGSLTGPLAEANWKLVWKISYTQVAPGTSKTLQFNLVAHDNNHHDSDVTHSVLFTVTINERAVPPPIAIRVVHQSGANVTNNQNAPFTILENQPLHFDVTATLGDNPTPIVVSSPGSFVQVTDQPNQAKHLNITTPCGPPGPYTIHFSSEDATTGAVGTATLYLDFQRSNRVPTTWLIYPNPDIFEVITKHLSISKDLDASGIGARVGVNGLGQSTKHLLPKELVRAPGPFTLYLVASSHDTEDTLAVSEQVTTFNPSQSTTVLPPNYVAADDTTLAGYPPFDAAHCTYNKVRKITFNAGPEGPGKVQIKFTITDGATGAGHTINTVANVELGHIWVDETAISTAINVGERDYVLMESGKSAKLRITASILGNIAVPVEASKSFTGGALTKVAGGYEFNWAVPADPRFQVGEHCKIVPLTLWASKDNIRIERTVRLIVTDAMTNAQQLASCIDSR